MPLPLSFELRLEERGARRVVVSVLLAPEGAARPARIDGVALQLQGRRGEPLGVQMVLPIAGELHQAMLSTVELKLDHDVPQGSRVVGTAWHGVEQREATVPTDPFTELEAHLRARRLLPVAHADVELEEVLPEERERLSHDFPWIDEPWLPPEAPQITVVDVEEPAFEDAEDLVNGLGLDAENASWLKELLQEDTV